MGNRHRLDLENRLDAYFATLSPSALRKVLRRSAANWQMYAAVTGSAMAMATGAAASNVANVSAARPNFVIAGQNGARVEIGRTSPAQAPSISPGGIVPIYGTLNTIQPGEWVTIYGTNLAGGIAVWNGDFPESLGGTSVEINGKAAYLMFVSPGQINLQAPDDTARGTVSVVVTTASGSATSTVTLGYFAPSFCLVNVQGQSGFIAGIIPRSNGSGAYGRGSYDILGPTGNSFGYRTVAAREGDVVELFGVGFGPTTPAVPAGKAFSGAASIDDSLILYINNVIVKPLFVGLSEAGLYQINLVVPSGLGEGEVPIEAIVGGLQTQSFVLFSLETITTTNPVTGGGTVGGIVGVTGGGFTGGGFGTGVGTGGGTGGGGTGGGGTGGDAVHKKKRYHPRLQFPATPK